MKELDWVGNSKERLKRFPEEARREGGRQLRRIQTGLKPEDWKTMSDVGSCVIEIRLHQPHEHRILYVASFSEAIYQMRRKTPSFKSEMKGATAKAVSDF